MEEIGYQAWSLISFDPDPTTGSPSFFKPPMFTSLVMDRGASLVFRFQKTPGRLQISMEVTALTSEGRTDQLFKLFTGTVEDSFRSVPCPGWKKSMEGLYASFTTQANPADIFLKILFDESVPITVNQVYFNSL